MLGLQAGPSVSMQPPLDRKNILTTQFEITNGGLLSLKDVRIKAFEIIIVSGGVLRERNIGGGYTPPTKSLITGETQTVAFKTFITSNAPIAHADIALIAFFKPAYMPFWKKRVAFRFATVRQDTGYLRLQKQPAADALAQYDQTLEKLRKTFPIKSFEP